MSFGWSVGDIAKAIEIIVQVGAALRETGGAASDYQDTVQFLNDLSLTLEGVRRCATQLPESTDAIAIQEQINLVKPRVAEFTTTIERSFGHYLGLQTKTANIVKLFFRGAHRKAQWALFVTKSVEKLREQISGPLCIIQMRMRLQLFDLIADIQTQLPSNLCDKVATSINNTLSAQMQQMFVSIQPTIEIQHKYTNLMVKNVTDRVEQQGQANLAQLSNLTSSIDKLPMRIATDVLTDVKLHLAQERSKSNLESQAMLTEALSRHTQEVKLLQKALLTNSRSSAGDISVLESNCVDVRSKPFHEAWEHFGQLLSLLAAGFKEMLGDMWYILVPFLCMHMRTLHQIARMPGLLLADNITFIDTLGRSRSLPFAYHCDWKNFLSFLETEFNKVPGEDKVRDEQFHIFNETEGQIVTKERWTNSVKPGCQLIMSVIMSKLFATRGSCPKCNRPSNYASKNSGSELGSIRIVCGCGLRYWTMNSNDAKYDNLYDGNDNKSYVYEETEPEFDNDEEDDKISNLPRISRVRCYSKRYYLKSCTNRLRYYYETFKIYPTPDTGPMEWAEDTDDRVGSGSITSTQHSVHPRNPRDFYRVTANGDIISGPSTASSERSIWLKRSRWDVAPRKKLTKKVGSKGPARASAEELIIVDEHDVFLDNLKRQRFKIHNDQQADREQFQIRLDREKGEQSQREQELQQQLDQEEQERRQREEYELKHYFRNVHITDTFAAGSWHCCGCHVKNNQVLALICIECGHVRCLSCDAGPEYFFNATLWKYSHQLKMASDYIRQSEGGVYSE